MGALFPDLRRDVAFPVAGAVLLFAGSVVLGLLYAGHMLVPNVGLRFLWPVWLVMTHALIVAAVTHTLARKVPALSVRATVLAALGWLIWSGLILGVCWARSAPDAGGVRALWPTWVSPLAAVGPAVPQLRRRHRAAAGRAARAPGARLHLPDLVHALTSPARQATRSGRAARAMARVRPARRSRRGAQARKIQTSTPVIAT